MHKGESVIRGCTGRTDRLIGNWFRMGLLLTIFFCYSIIPMIITILYLILSVLIVLPKLEEFLTRIKWFETNFSVSLLS